MTEEELFLDIEAGLRKIDLQKKYKIGRIRLDNYLAEYELEITAPRQSDCKKRSRSEVIALLKQYTAQGYDVTEIAGAEDVYPATVRRWYIENGLTANPPKSRLGRPGKEELRHLYHTLGLTMNDIATRYNTNRGRVNGWIRHYGLGRYKQKPKDRTARNTPAHVKEL